MIFTESTIKISNNVSKMDSTIVLYRGDKNVEIRFTILQSPFKYSNTVATNVIESTNASYGQLVIKTPNDKPPIFSEVSATKEGTVLFTITKEMIDEIEEVGVYTFQIRLMDENKQSRVTIPPVENGIEIKEPIAIEDDNTTNVVGLAKANYAVATSSDVDTPTFDDNGKYNKTNWNDGDIITNASLNKIEDGIYTTNENVTATKKYVDDKVTIKILPVDYNKNCATNVADLEPNSIYMSPNDAKFLYLAYEKLSGSLVGFLFTAKAHGRFIYTGAKDDTKIEIMMEGSCYTVYFKTDTVDAHIEKTVFYLTKNNTTEFTPSNDYEPATKKYVDDIKTDIVGNNVEPQDSDIPRVFFNGEKPTSKTAVHARIEYKSKTKHFKGYVEIKCQGTSSMAYPKKNYTIKPYEDETKTKKLKIDFKGWGKQSKFCLKANYIDHSHARNICAARLWNQIVASRANYSLLPELLRTSPCNGAIDGFPIKVYYNDTYEGVYTWNIPKDKWMFNMDDTLDNHCVLCGEEYDSGCFLTANASLWSDEIHDVMPTSIVTSFNAFQNFVINSTDDEFKANLENYVYVDSLIDYYIFQYAICGLDSMGKNQLFATYDGTKWIATSYDMDSTFGLYWNGQSYVSATYRMQEDYESGAHGKPNKLYVRLEKLFVNEIKARYKQLRSDILSYNNIVNTFEPFMDIIGKDLYAEDLTIYTGIPNGDSNNIQQIRNYYRDRLVYVDAQINALQEAIPCTNITLNNATLSFTTTDIQTLTVTVTPTNTTDAIVWSVNPTGICTVENGTVTPTSNGQCTITATCGTKSATCNVTVNNVSNVSDIDYELSEPLACDGTSTYKDTGIQLLSSNNVNRDWTMLLDFTVAQYPTTGNMAVVHCMKEANGYPGVNIDITGSARRVVVPNNKEIYTGPQAVINTPIQYALVKQGKLFTVYNKTGVVLGSAETSDDIIPIDQTLLLGAYQTVDEVKGRFFNGAINKFKLVEEIYTVPQIAQYFGIVDEPIAYTLPQETTFNGTSDYVDTGIQLFKTDQNFTITMDVTADTQTGEQTALLHCMREAYPYRGLCVQSANGAKFRLDEGNNKTAIGNLVPISQRTKLIIVKNGTTMKVYNSNNVTGESVYNFTSLDQTLLLGAYQTVDGTKGRFFKGTIHEFSISNTVYSNEQINTYLGVNVATD